MPNTQTSVPAFTAGQVLTAAQMTEVNTGIPVFATTTTRDAAFGGTGEKTLAEGQFAYIEASNTTQYYDGAAWQTVGGGLTLIKTQTIGTAVSSVAVTDVFSSTYDNYRVIVSGGVASANNRLNLTFGATTTGYYRFLIYGNYSSNTVNGEFAANTSSFSDVGTGSVNSLSCVVDIIAPNLAKNTGIHAHTAQTATNGLVFFNQGYLANTTQYTAFTFTASTDNWTGGTIRVYGYQNS